MEIENGTKNMEENNLPMTKKEKWLIALTVTIGIIVLIGMFIWLITFTIDRDNQDRTEFISQVNQISVGLTEYQEEKLDYYIIRYCNRDTEFGRYYDIISFERFIKGYDYEFWYDIRYIFSIGE